MFVIIIIIYTENCQQLKQDEMFECNNTILDEELLLSQCNSFKQHDFDENCYFEENFLGKLIFFDENQQNNNFYLPYRTYRTSVQRGTTRFK